MNHYFIIHLLLITIGLVTITKAAFVGTETAEPAAFLRPRNFNPHPYEKTNKLDQLLVDRYIKPSPSASASTSNNIYNPGPVQFPSNNDANSRRTSQNPYAALALKNQDQPLHRFSGQDNRVVAPAYDALARYANKVLHKRVNYVDESDDDNDNGNYVDEDLSSSTKKQYAFSYTVRDAASGDDFSHSQQQKDGAVHGSYKVQLPDGRTQIVKYTADNNGYRADVSYSEDNQNLADNFPTRAPLPVHQPNALSSAKPIYDYYKNIHQQGEGHSYNTDGLSQGYNNYDLYARQPIAGSAAATPIYKPPQINLENVQIKNYNTAPQNIHQYDEVLISTPPPTFYYTKTATVKPHINYLSSTTPSTVDYQDISVLPSPTSLPTYLNHQKPTQILASNPNYEYYSTDNGNSGNGGKPINTIYGQNYADYDYEAIKSLPTQATASYIASATDATHSSYNHPHPYHHQQHGDESRTNGRVALYYQTKK